jgi:hypothetical protein
VNFTAKQIWNARAGGKRGGIVGSQLLFSTLDESGTTWNEHTIDFSQLDLEKTIAVSKQRGFNFVLRDEPSQQYLQDHPGIGTPGSAPTVDRTAPSRTTQKPVRFNWQFLAALFDRPKHRT